MEPSRFALTPLYRRYKPWLRRWGLPLALFLLALLVRGSTLGEFLTVDEPKWLDRSRWFLTGLLFPNQECPPQYAVPLPELASDSYTLDICLTTTGGDPVLADNEFSACLPVPVMVEDS